MDRPVVLEEASLIVEGDHIAGRITSSRMSPTRAGPCAWLRSMPGRPGPGTEATEPLPNGRLIAATVIAQLAHVDPDGKLMCV